MQSKRATATFRLRHKVIAVIATLTMLVLNLMLTSQMARADDATIPLSVILNGNGGVLSTKTISGLTSVFPSASITDAKRPGYRLIGFSGTSADGTSVNPAATPGWYLDLALRQLKYTGTRSRLSDYTLTELQSVSAYLSNLYAATNNGTDNTYENNDIYKEFHNYLLTDSKWSVTSADGATESLTFRIVGINHDDKADGSGKAGLTLMMTHRLKGTYAMNLTDTNSGGWTSSNLRVLCGGGITLSDGDSTGDIWSILPPTLRKAIVTVEKSTIKTGGSTEITTSSERLWVPSVSEIYGDTNTQPEGTQYEYFMNKGVTPSNYSAVNQLTYNTSNQSDYIWLRGPYANSSTVRPFTAIEYNGNNRGGATQNLYPPTRESGIILGLCL